MDEDEDDEKNGVILQSSIKVIVGVIKIDE